MIVKQIVNTKNQLFRGHVFQGMLSIFKILSMGTRKKSYLTPSIMAGISLKIVRNVVV